MRKYTTGICGRCGEIGQVPIDPSAIQDCHRCRSRFAVATKRLERRARRDAEFQSRVLAMMGGRV